MAHCRGPEFVSHLDGQHQNTYPPASSTPPQSSDFPWFAYRHASTLQEGVLTGRARLLHAKGLYNQLTADAYVRAQEGYTKQLENRQLEVATHFKVKQINADYRAQTMPRPLSKEKLDQWNQQDQPGRLSRQEYNSDTGSLQWPAVLQAQVFDNHRLVLDDLFARRSAGEFGVNSPFYQTVNSNSAQMRDMLKRYLKSEERWFSAQEYTAAQNFLNGMVQKPGWLRTWMAWPLTNRLTARMRASDRHKGGYPLGGGGKPGRFAVPSIFFLRPQKLFHRGQQLIDRLGLNLVRRIPLHPFEVGMLSQLDLHGVDQPSEIDHHRLVAPLAEAFGVHLVLGRPNKAWHQLNILSLDARFFARLAARAHSWSVSPSSRCPLGKSQRWACLINRERTFRLLAQHQHATAADFLELGFPGLILGLGHDRLPISNYRLGFDCGYLRQPANAGKTGILREWHRELVQGNNSAAVSANR